MIESDDVANAIAEEVSKHGINKLIIGASSHGLFTRYLFGTIYILSSVRFSFYKNRLEISL